MISVKSSVSSLVRIWKIRHLSPGCSFAWILRVVYFPVKPSCRSHERAIIKTTKLAFLDSAIHNSKAAQRFGQYFFAPSISLRFFVCLFIGLVFRNWFRVKVTFRQIQLSSEFRYSSLIVWLSSHLPWDFHNLTIKSSDHKNGMPWKEREKKRFRLLVACYGTGCN